MQVSFDSDGAYTKVQEAMEANAAPGSDEAAMLTAPRRRFSFSRPGWKREPPFPAALLPASTRP